MRLQKDGGGMVFLWNENEEVWKELEFARF